MHLQTIVSKKPEARILKISGNIKHQNITHSKPSSLSHIAYYPKYKMNQSVIKNYIKEKAGMDK
jgi:S-adenosylmethionine hydrolase